MKEGRDEIDGRVEWGREFFTQNGLPLTWAKTRGNFDRGHPGAFSLTRLARHPPTGQAQTRQPHSARYGDRLGQCQNASKVNVTLYYNNIIILLYYNAVKHVFFKVWVNPL